MFALALRNVFRQTRRTLITMSTIIVGVAGLIVIGGFVKDIFIQLQEATIHSQVGHIQVYREGYTEMGRRNPYQYLIDDPSQLVESISSRPHVIDTLQRLNFSGLANNGRADMNIIGEGVEPDKEAQLGTAITIVEGRQLTAADEFGIVMGRGVAKNLQLKPGDYVSLMVSTAEGALNSLEFEVVGTFKSFASDYDNSAVRISLPAAQELAATWGIHSVVVSLDATEHTDALASALKSEVTNDGYEVKVWYEIADFYSKAVNLYSSQLAVLQFIVLLMILLSVTNSVNMVVHEREGEFGTLMALGNRQNEVFRLILAENTILGFLGAGAGITVGILLAEIISGLGIEMPPLPNSQVGYIANIRLVPSVIALAFGVGFMATVLASVLPARRVSRQPVVDALRKNI
ncbi:ABC transporter permease [Pseudomaricurvus alcaniphilus]|nr:ABC transporter permease [Pseudomaricurvus alcaniphilus]